MKKLGIIYLALIFSLFLNCEEKRSRIDYITEDGVKVILNYIEPYKLNGKFSNFNLNKVWEIDTEKKAILETGLVGIYDFDIDSRGNVYIINSESNNNFIFKFDPKGNYLLSFCRKGEGPEEITNPPKIRITDNDEITINSGMKILFFTPEGKFLKEVKSKYYFFEALYLENGNFLIKTGSLPVENESGLMERKVILYDSHFNEIKILDRITHENILVKRVKGTFHNLVCEVNDRKIFIGNQERGYEILIFDFNGNLIKKIRKEYRKIPTSKEYKEKFMNPFKKNPRIFNIIKDKIYFPPHLPPFHYFITDEKGKIYVMTYEKEKNKGEYMFDIFNENGAFVGRKSLKDFSYPEGLRGKFKNNYFYRVEEKENGFEKLVAYKVIWK